MTPVSPNVKKEIRNCLALLLEGQIEPGQFAQLEQLLKGSDAAQEYYLDLLDISISLRKLDWTLEKTQGERADVLDRELWLALSDSENTAPAIECQRCQATPEERRIYIEKLAVPKAERHTSRLSLFVALGSLAAMLLMLAYVYLNPKISSEPVAMVRDSLDAVWASASEPAKPGDVISSRDSARILLSGTVKIDSLLGPELVIEGPAIFSFPDMSKMMLHSGKVYARVPKNAIGYTVRTPSFSVIDLGTEFGVDVDTSGTGDVMVFNGRASLVAGTQGQTRESHLLTEGTAKRVYAIGQEVEDIAFKPKQFVQDLNSQEKTLWRGEPIDLADILGGGNGLGTGRIGCGIEPLKGESGAYKTPAGSMQQGSGHYVRTSNRFVDGIFVPDGGEGPVQVSSKGHRFDGCPDTEGVYWMAAMDGGQFAHYPGARQSLLKLDGQEYGTAEHPAIFLHSNLGITYDLNAIRRAIPSAELDAFVARCGISDTGPQRSACADFRVLVDGKVRFSQNGVGPSQVHSINIPLAKEDQYLTLMCTDGGRQVCLTVNGVRYPIDSDWCMFAEPRLTLKTK